MYRDGVLTRGVDTFTHVVIIYLWNNDGNECSNVAVFCSSRAVFSLVTEW